VNVDLPLPTNLVILTLLLPGIAVAGHELGAWLTQKRLLRHALTPVLALALWLLSVHAAALVTRSFVAGLRVGTLAVALAGLASRVHRGRASRGASEGPGLGPAAMALVALSTIPVAWMAFNWAFHDEDLYTGHMSISAEIQNDVYPPRHLTFPDLPLRYHYGFNLLVACITALTRARVDVGIDIATVLLWICTGSVLWALGDLWFGRGWLTLLLTLFAGGPPVCLFDPPGISGGPPGRCRILGPGVLAPLVSNFFQHPWALGLPLSLSALLVFSAREHERRRARLVVLWLLCTALSLGHVVLFMTVLPSIVAAEVWFAWTEERRPLGAAGLVATAAASVTAAVVLGASVISFGGSGPAALVFKLGVGNGLADTLRWHAQSYGVALPLALLGLPFVPRAGRVVTALLLGGSLLVVDTVRYVHSGDIIKFGVVASVAMALAGAAAVNRLILARRGLRLAPRALLGGLCAALLLVSSWGGLAFALFFFSKTVDRYYAHALPPMAPDDQRAASFIRSRVKAGEMVFRREGPAAGYAQWAGLPVPWSDWATRGFGFPQERFDARSRLCKALPAAPGPYLAEGIDWFVLEPADATLGARADAWIAGGQAAQLATFGRLRVVKLGP
jgi:hypothetical protein